MGKNIVTLSKRIAEINEKLVDIQILETAIADRVWKAAKPLISKQQISERASEIAEQLFQLTESNPDLVPVLVGVANGGVPFLMKLVSKLNDIGVVFEWDIRSSSSYGTQQTSGDLTLGEPGKVKLGGKTVFIVDDILDTGKTWEAIKKSTEALGADSVHMIAMLDKGLASTPADYVGFRLTDNPYVVGYGLDLLGSYLRDKKEVRAVDPSTLPTEEEMAKIHLKTQYDKELISLIAEKEEALKSPEKPGSVAPTLSAFLASVSASSSHTLPPAPPFTQDGPQQPLGL